jgi:hypothetical protein
MQPWKFAGDTEDRKAGMDKQQKRKFHGSIYIYTDLCTMFLCSYSSGGVLRINQQNMVI